MKSVILPYALGSTKNKKAVSEITFSVDSNIQNFSRIIVSRLKFMKLYDEERFNLSQYPFTEYWGDTASIMNASRAIVSLSGEEDYNFQLFGHPHNKELRALDELPHKIEIRIKNLTKVRDNISIKRRKTGEYQSIDSEKSAFEEFNSSIQTMLVYNTDIRFEQDSGAYVGTISCDMKDLGSFNVKNKGFGDTFTIEVAMYNFRGLAMSFTPSCELSLLFR